MSLVLKDLLVSHLSTLFLILLFGIKLWSKKTFRGMETKYFWLPFVVPTCYLFLILWNTIRRATEGHGPERWIASICVVFCLAATIVDAFFGGQHLNEAIIISTVFIYIILYSHDNRLDPLTGLLNRQAFYDDCRVSGKNVRAVFSMDMDGLKEINDTLGHQAGDDALRQIGECIGENTDRYTQAYRTGGDEFMLLIFRDAGDEIAALERNIREAVTERGYHISAGYARSGQNQDLDAAIRESDRLMYEDKARYYQESGKERRRR